MWTRIWEIYFRYLPITLYKLLCYRSEILCYSNKISIIPIIIDHTSWQPVYNAPTKVISATVGILGNSNVHLPDDKTKYLKVNCLFNVALGVSSKLIQASSCWIYGHKFIPSLLACALTQKVKELMELMHSLEEKHLKNRKIFSTIHL